VGQRIRDGRRCHDYCYSRRLGRAHAGQRQVNDVDPV
jgi:hypothetical protein